MTRKLTIHLLGLLHVCVAAALAWFAPMILGHAAGTVVVVLYVLAIPAAYLACRRGRGGRS